MGIGGFIKKVGEAVGGFFGKVFVGAVKVFMEDFEDIAEQIVLLLMFAKGKSGKEKLSTAIDVLKGYAAEKGKKYINQSARLLVQLELTKAEDDDLERIIKEGLKPALKVIGEVNLLHLMDDNHRRAAAFTKLSNDLKAAGKNWLLKPRRIHTLIELAVAKAKALKVAPKAKAVARPKAVAKAEAPAKAKAEVPPEDEPGSAEKLAALKAKAVAKTKPVGKAGKTK